MEKLIYLPLLGSAIALTMSVIYKAQRMIYDADGVRPTSPKVGENESRRMRASQVAIGLTLLFLFGFLHNRSVTLQGKTWVYSWAMIMGSTVVALLLYGISRILREQPPRTLYKVAISMIAALLSQVFALVAANLLGLRIVANVSEVLGLLIMMGVMVVFFFKRASSEGS